MTQHILEQDTLEDRQTLQRLGIVIAEFVVATAVMAVIITAVMG